MIQIPLAGFSLWISGNSKKRPSDLRLSLENAIHKMTHMPATKFGIANRGLIKEDYYADLVLFDPDLVIDGATYENPRVGPVGVPHVIVNGMFAVRDGNHAGSRSGRALRRGVG